MNGGDLPLEVLFNGVFWLWLLALVPAAVVTLTKGRLLLFFAGWVTFGLTWLIGARPARASAAWIAGAVAALLVVGLFAARPAPVVGIDGSALQYSVESGPLSFDTRPCEQLADHLWRCRAADEEASGTVPYRVKTRRLGCWTATRIGPEFGDESRRRLSGCVTIWDQLRLWDSLL